MKNKNRGFALLVVMMVFLVVAGVTGYWLKNSSNFFESSQSKSKQEILYVQSKSRLLEFQNHALEKMTAIINAYKDCIRGGGNPTSCGISHNPDIMADLHLEDGENLQMACTAQGESRAPCNKNPAITPKILSFKFSKQLVNSKEHISLAGEWQISPLRLNDFAYLVLNEPTNKVTVGKNVFDGKFGVIFSNVVVGPLTNLNSTRIQFANRSDEDVIFNELLYTNAPIDQFDLGIPHPFYLPGQLVYWYPIKPPELRKGAYTQASSPTGMLSNFQTLASAPETYKHQGEIPLNARIELGSPSDPCALKVYGEIAFEQCFETKAPSLLDYRYAISGGLGELVPVIGGMPGSGAGGAPAQTTQTCYSYYAWSQLDYPTSQADGMVIYVDSENPIKITSQGDLTSDKKATICKNMTIIAGHEVNFAKGIERMTASGGEPPDDQALGALINIHGSNNVLPSTLTQLSQAATLGDLKSICNSTSNCAAAGIDINNDVSLNVEMSLIALSGATDPTLGASALKVSPDLTSTTTPGLLAGLRVEGLFVGEKSTPNKGMLLNGWPPTPIVVNSGFNFTTYKYPKGLQENPPPGITKASSDVAMSISMTALEHKFSTYEEALAWSRTVP